MSDHLEHSRRWEHRPQPPRVTYHWPADLAAERHRGDVSDCSICQPQDGAA